MGKVFGILGLVFGLIGLFVFWFVFGPLAIIFGAIGIAKDDSKGLGIAGLILGIVDIVCVLILWLLLGTIGFFLF